MQRISAKWQHERRTLHVRSHGLPGLRTVARLLNQPPAERARPRLGAGKRSGNRDGLRNVAAAGKRQIQEVGV